MVPVQVITTAHTIVIDPMFMLLYILNALIATTTVADTNKYHTIVLIGKLPFFFANNEGKWQFF
jgi:hypothetical protein